MRTRPLHLAVAVMLALSGTAFAQTTSSRAGSQGLTVTTTGATGTAGSTAGATGTGSTPASRAAVGGCTPSGGSTCSTADTNTNANTSTGTATTTTTSPAAGTTGSTGGAASVLGPQATQRVQGDNTVSTDPTLTRPRPFEPGGAFGPAAVPSTTPGTGVVTDSGVVVPGSAQMGTQQNVFVQPQPQPSGVTVLNTPLLDQVAREGRAKEQRRRAAGDEPRIIGIAPRTERDLTWQMPDDPIIRY